MLTARRDFWKNRQDQENPNFTLLTKEGLRDAHDRYLKKRKGIPNQNGRALSRASFVSNMEDMADIAERQPLLQDPTMAAGQPVPPKLGAFPRPLLGKPVEEIDPALRDERTFIVVAKRFGSTNILRFSGSDALFLLSPLHPLRRLTLKILSHQLFDMLVIATILVNCVFMALDQPVTNYWEEINPLIETSPNTTTPSRLYLEIAEFTFASIYNIEMLVKIGSRGFVFSEHSYLRDPWNWLDFIVILLAYATFGLQVAKIDPGNFAVLRSFRVLRALKTISIIPGLKVIINAFLGSLRMLVEVILLTLFVLMIFSLLALQSFMGTLLQKCVIDLNVSQTANVSDQQWFDFAQNSSNWLQREGAYVVCSNISLFGQQWSPCPSGYQCLPDIGDNPNDGYTNFDNIFWSMVTGFQLITLDYWENVYNLIIKAQGPLAVMFFMLTSMLGSFYLINLMLAVVAMSYTEEMRNSKKELERKRKSRKSILELDANELMRLVEEKKRKQERRKVERRKSMVVPGQADPPVNTVSYEVAKSSNVDGTVTINGHRESIHAKNDSIRGHGAASSSVPSVDCCPSRCFGCCRGIFMCPAPIHRCWVRLQVGCQWIVLDPLLDLFITITILLNTLCLSLDHYQIDETFDYVLTVGNTICTVIFCIECALKVCALGYSFFKNNWNNFDLFIVITSLAEIPLQGVSGLSVLRTFRLLRVLKLAQSWTTMRVLLSIIFSSISAVANVSVVLILVIFIFAVVGMQLFGANYTSGNFPDGVPRWNFVDFPHSIMLIFRILCGEWIEPLYDCMSCSNTGLCLAVFISTLIVGNILILNLFLALLLNSFASDSLKKEEEDSRLGLAFQKLRRIFTFLLRSVCCCFLKTGLNNRVNDTSTSPMGSTQPSGSLEGREDERATVEGQLNAFVVAKVSPNRRESRTEIGRPNEAFGMNETDVKIPLEPAKRMGNRLKPIARRSNLSVPPDDHISVANEASTATTSRKLSATQRPVSSLSKNSETGEMEAKLSDDDTGDENDTNQSDGSTGTTPDHVPTESFVRPCCPGPIDRWCLQKYKCPCYKAPEQSELSNIWRSIRRSISSVVEHRIFEWTILLCIFISSSMLVFDDIYLDEKPVFKEVLRMMDLFFVTVFFVEMLLKWIGLGFKSYFTSFWCLLDFVIVCISLTSVAADVFSLSDIGAFRSLRTLRALRPLRAISRWQGMKIVVNALAFAIPSIANVLLVCLMFWLIFAIIGVQLFRGTFYRCTDDQGDLVPIDIVSNMTECLDLNYRWSNAKIHFDNVYYAVIALFQVATFEGWMEIMESAIDNRGVNMQPSRESSFHAYLFFMVFIIFGSFFFLNLFIGVIIDNFNKLKRKYEGDRTLDVFMTSSQKNYYQTMRKLGNKKPRKQIKAPENKFLSFCYKLTTSTRFEVAIVTVIVLNMVAMMIEHYRMSDTLKSVLDVINMVFTAIFVLEAALKIIALRWFYFKSPWNTFDFIVVLFSVLGIILSDIMSAFLNPTLLRVFRLLRIGRILRLVKSAKGLRKLLFALIISLPALFNIGCLLFLIIFIFAIIGMSQFAHVRLQGALDEVVNFQTWTKSMLLLFRVSTSAGWNDVLDALMTEGAPDCDPEYGGLPNGDCGNTAFAFVYFLIFLVLSFLIVINTYIAVILENFSAAHAQEEVGITEDDFGMFYKTWERYDPNATQFIDLEQLSDFCDALEMPLKLSKPNQIKIAGLSLPVYSGTKLHCLDVLFSLTKRVLGTVEESDDFAELQQQMTVQFKKAFPELEHIQPTTTTMQINKEHTAAKVVQRAWRIYRMKIEFMRCRERSGVTGDVPNL